MKNEVKIIGIFIIASIIVFTFFLLLLNNPKSDESDEEIVELKNLTNTIETLITNEFSKIGLVNEDGKIEVGFDMERRLVVVDVLGTLDECRFTYDGLPVSKELARIYYRNTEWYTAVNEAKKKDR